MRGLRHVPKEVQHWTDKEKEPIAIVEVTTRCIQGRFLLKPTPKNTDRLLGVLGRVQDAFIPGSCWKPSQAAAG